MLQRAKDLSAAICRLAMPVFSKIRSMSQLGNSALSCAFVSTRSGRWTAMGPTAAYFTIARLERRNASCTKGGNGAVEFVFIVAEFYGEKKVNEHLPGCLKHGACLG